jgi:hypothetical protein
VEGEGGRSEKRAKGKDRKRGKEGTPGNWLGRGGKGE